MKQTLPLHHDYKSEIEITKPVLIRYNRTKHWKELSRAVAERDRCCRRCGYNGPKLEAHHVEYLSLTNCRPENLILLCRRCHGCWHKIKVPTPWPEWLSRSVPEWDGVPSKSRGTIEAQRAARKRYRFKHRAQVKLKERRRAKRRKEEFKIFTQHRDRFMEWLRTQPEEAPKP